MPKVYIINDKKTGDIYIYKIDDNCVYILDVCGSWICVDKPFYTIKEIKEYGRLY